MTRFSRVAAVYDVHGNLPALEAVLSDVEKVGAELVVVGGDVAAGPMPTEVLDRLGSLGGRALFVRGNADREMVAAYDAGRAAREVIGAEDPVRAATAWAASRIGRGRRDLLASFEDNVVVEIEGLGEVLFCHGSPRSDEEILTAVTPEERLREVLAGTRQDLVVCGHTHVQFDRSVEGVRVVNAGSTGMPYQGEPVGAFWLLLGPDVSFRRSGYDIEEAVRKIRATGYPGAEDLAEILVKEPPDPSAVADFFENQAAGA